MKPRLAEAGDGVMAMMPATSRKASELPAVAAGSVSVIWNEAWPCAGTVTWGALKATVCGEPCWLVTTTLKVTAELPVFFTWTIPLRVRSVLNSSRPKFKVVSSLSA